MKKIFTLKILLVLALLLSVAKLNAQVHIGADVAPQPFSVLELYAKYKTDPVDTYGGLRLPQLDTIQRNALSRTYGSDPAFYGLTIYNTNNNCLEYWNATRWVSLCLGTADIWLEGDCDPTECMSANDEAECTYTPRETSPCAVSSGQPYMVYLAAGFAYTRIRLVDEFTSKFAIQFDVNNTAFPRIAIVRVTNNCTGEFKDFLFTQCAGDCPDGDAFSVSSNSTVLCGTDGAAIAWITNPQSGMSYIWGRNGVPVHTGNYYEIRHPDTYTVYAGLFGCTDPTPQEITITQAIPGTSPDRLFVRADNNAMICSGGSVILTAYTPTYPVQWFHNGKMYTGTYSDGTAGPPSANPLTVSTASAAGEWFAVQIDAPCGSQMSNIVTLISLNIPALPYPCAKVNGKPLEGTGIDVPVICINGTLELEICNYAAYPAGTTFTWYFNGIMEAITTRPIISRTPSGIGELIISVQASHSLGVCPSTATSGNIGIVHEAPPPTGINGDAVKAAICGSNPAILMADIPSGIEYEWLRWSLKSDPCQLPCQIGLCRFGKDVAYDKMPSNTFRYDADTMGCYGVRYKDANGCWSDVSDPAIFVIQSAVISLEWDKEPPSSAALNTQETYSVKPTPFIELDPPSYNWSRLYPSIIISMIPTNLNFSTVQYGGIAGFDTIRVTATNLCGTTAPLRKRVTVAPICIPVTSVNISPSTTVNITLCPGSAASTTFIATPNGSADGRTFRWYVNNVLQSGTSSSFTFPTPSTAGTYNIRATATNDCTAIPVSTATVPIIITLPPLDVSGNYVITGKVCYDVRRTGYTTTSECKPLAGRHDDFLMPPSTPILTFGYTFSSPNGSTFSNVTFSVIDHASPNNLLASTSPATSNPFNITFRSDINTRATGFSKNDPRGKLTIVATFWVGTSCRRVELDVYVQDCVCGCTVNRSGGGTLTFMCYNLGASEAVKRMTPLQQWTTSSATGTGVTNAAMYGDLQQWGRRTDGHEKRNSPQILGNTQMNSVTLDANGQIPSTNATYYGVFIYTTAAQGDWRGTTAARQDDYLWRSSVGAKTVNDPCPDGWRVPTQSEWGDIFRGGTTSGGPNTATVNTWTWVPPTTGTAGYRISPDGGKNYTLFLPAAGYRLVNPGSLGQAGTQGRYWSSSPSGRNASALYFTSGTINPNSGELRARGESIRCVAQ